MWSALSQALIHIACFSFVDDCDLIINGESINTTGEELQESFQSALTAWSNLLCVSGGELSGEKSWCYIIDFIWNGCSWEYRYIDEMEGSYYLLSTQPFVNQMKRSTCTIIVS